MRKILKKIIHNNKGKVHLTFRKGWPYGCLFIFLLCSCIAKNKPADYTKQYQQIDSIKILLRSGDLIVRNGTDDVSQATRRFNRKDTGFSHCGIILVENNTPFVYHALGGKYNPSQQLMRQPVDSFCNPAENDKFAVYRYSISQKQIDSLQNIVQKYFANKLPFDMFFNFETDGRMYCSEFVFKSYNTAMQGALTPYLHKEQEPVFVSIDDLYLNGSTGLIARIDFVK